MGGMRWFDRAAVPPAGSGRAVNLAPKQAKQACAHLRLQFSNGVAGLGGVQLVALDERVLHGISSSLGGHDRG